MKLQKNEGLEELLNQAPQCEHSRHQRHHVDEPAAYVVRKHCPSCGHRTTYLCCRYGWEYMGMLPNGVQATCCGYRCHRDETLKIVAEL